MKTADPELMRAINRFHVMAETVVALSSVTWQIWTRDTGPWRRIASITWKRLIARMSSGSAVFIGRGFAHL
jgi:hypothetical protein